MLKARCMRAGSGAGDVSICRGVQEDSGFAITLGARVCLSGYTAHQVLRQSLVVVLIALGLLALPGEGVAQNEPSAPSCEDPYTTVDTACVLPSSADTYGYLSQPGDRRVYRFDSPAPGTLLKINLIDLPADYDLYLADANGDTLAQSAHDGLTPESVSIRLEDAESVYVYVTSDPSRDVIPDQPYHLVFQATVPVVGPLNPPAAAGPADPNTLQVPTATPSPVAPAATETPAPVPAAPVTLRVSPADVSWVRNVIVTWANIPNASKNDQFALYRVGADDQSHGPVWYTSCEAVAVEAHPSGSCTITVDPLSPDIGRWMSAQQAQWEFRLFAGGTYGGGTRVATSNPITISWGGTPVVAVKTTISTNVSSINKAQNLTVTWNNIPDPNKQNVIGLYRVGTDDGVNSMADHWYVSCETVAIAAAASGTCSLLIDPPNNAQILNTVLFPRRSVQYEFRLFTSWPGSGVRLATSAPFTISPPAS
jgi:hypothetical protein